MNFYKSAALTLDHLDKHQGSVKGSLTAAGIKSSSSGEAKRILALVIETLKYRLVLQQILVTVPLFSLERLTFPKKTPPLTPTSSSLLLVLLHDLLFSSKSRIEASEKWPPKEAILRHQARLRAELVRIQINEGKSRKEDLSKKPEGGGEARYVRWNPNTDRHRSGDWSLPALFRHLEAPPLSFKRLDGPAYPVPEKSFFLDAHLPECLLVFPATSSWWTGDKWYEAGAVILQDKASCLPAKVLMEGWEDGEGECQDATAAPGNKTSHISALMGGKGRLYAFERSPFRYKTLEKMLALSNCLNVVAQRADFLDTDPLSPQFAKVTRILLDPSCSGSGIVNRLDYLLEDDLVDETDAKAERLEKLATFQLQMVQHAFKFPAAKRIVYSTCSIHPEEDERVVLQALATTSDWELAPRKTVLPSWERRGRPDEMGGNPSLAESVIRCLPSEDKTNGFFVACFVRAGNGTKRSREPSASEEEAPSEDEEEAVDEKTRPASSAVKTAAQLERARRKKQSQKKRRKVVQP